MSNAGPVPPPSHAGSAASAGDVSRKFLGQFLFTGLFGKTLHIVKQRPGGLLELLLNLDHVIVMRSLAQFDSEIELHLGIIFRKRIQEDLP